jgi:arylsulfatase A-like enzyme
LAALVGCVGVHAGSTAQKPNLVVFLVDDLGWQDVSQPFCTERTAQNATFHTPNLERLCSEGARFTQAYAHCVCTPSRIGILTGEHPARTGVTNWTLRKDTPTDAPHATLTPPNWNCNGLQPGHGVERSYSAPTLPQRLAKQGYETIHVGKAHFGAAGTRGAEPLQLGFTKNVAGHAAGAPASYLAKDGFARSGSDPIWNVPGLDAWHGKDAFLTDVLTQEAIALVSRAIDERKPFFLHLAHYAVHTPIQRDEARIARYPAMGLDPKEAAYAALVEGIDDSLGALVEFLRARGALDNTVIVFASDNGGLSAHARGGTPHTHNAPLRSGKGSAYEGGVRTPFAIRWPSVAAPGSVIDAPCAIEDVFPTLCNAGGADASCNYGQDLAPLLAGEKRDRDLFWHYPHSWGATGPGISMTSSIRSGDWKLAWFWDRAECELYDLSKDLGEQRDLAAAQPETARALRNKLRAFLLESRAMLPVRKDGIAIAMP